MQGCHSQYCGVFRWAHLAVLFSMVFSILNFMSEKGFFSALTFPSLSSSTTLEGRNVGARKNDRCSTFANDGKWDEDLQQWHLTAPAKSMDALYEFLYGEDGTSDHGSNDIGNAKENNNLGWSHRREEGKQDFHHVLFCGDSTVARLYDALPFANLSSEPLVQVKRVADRCGLMEYYGLERAKEWIAPNRTVEGPCRYGQAHPFCTDCAGCNSQLRASYYPDGRMEKSYEYISVEFARDREFQTEVSSTSQETLGLYLEKSPPKDVCIVASGVHDVILMVNTTTYTGNVVDYVNILKRHCKKIFWLQISASLDKQDYNQRHDTLRRFNDAVLQSCHALGSQVLIYDIWNMSFPPALHADNIHHKLIYYQQLGKLLLTPLYGAL